MKAYLAWPVKLPNCKLHAHHITLKYLGTQEMTPEQLVKKIDEIQDELSPSLSPTALKWKHARFGKLSVLLIEGKGICEDCFTFNKRLEELRMDDYPTWNPHITVTPVEAEYIKNNKFGADVIESIGPLTLYVDHVPTYFYCSEKLEWMKS